MKYILSDLLKMRKGRIVNITVWDCFTGKVKIIKNRLNKWLIEIVDVSMCYDQQVPCQSGEQMWIRKKDLFRDSNKHTYKKKRRKHKISSPQHDWDNELPF